MAPQTHYCSVCWLVDPHNFTGVVSIRVSVFLAAGRYDRCWSRVSSGFSLALYENHPGSFEKCRCMGPQPDMLI